MNLEQSLQKLSQLYQAEIETISTSLNEDSFNLMETLTDSAEKIRVLSIIQQALLGEDEDGDMPPLDHLGSTESTSTLEDFLRAVSSDDIPTAVETLSNVLQLQPEAASACTQNFLFRWNTDPRTFEKIRQFIATSNPNQYQWLLYELFGITGIPNS